jgi:DNA polymerase-3 subunit gamma/tau
VSSGPSLYRRHRPRTFADVVGQEHVVTTLRNAVEQDKVHHAYLFVGSRGTGKTSMAKILAACLNCEHGPTVTPDGTCDSCVAIASASSLDVIEMDAASNNSVDDIRDLRERVSYAPVSGRHKVYILDEAHMLSTQAWNAFLKTLEEPPPNTIFVLATTEAQKVLPTVADRCHRFDFARPSAEEIATVLRRVAGAEDISLPEPATALIARHARGSFRDALGTLEQLVTYGGPSVNVDSVRAVLGVADSELLFAAVDAAASGDPRAALGAVERLNATGRDAGLFLSDLEGHGRELLVAGTLGEVPLELRVTPEQDQRTLEQAERAGLAAVVRLLDLIVRARQAIRDGADARTQLEVVLLKAAVPDVEPSTQALQARIERLEAALRSGGGTPPPSVPIGPGSGRGADEVRATDQRSAAPPPRPTQASAPPAPAAPAAATAAAVAPEPEPEPDPAPAPVAESGVVDALGQVDLDGVRQIWPAVLETVQGVNAMLAALLQGARPAALERDELTLFFAESASFLKRKAEETANRDIVAQAIQQLTGSRLNLRYELSDETEDGAPGAPPPGLSDEELVDRLMSELDAEELIVEAPAESTEPKAPDA